jgi:hypothetical protein
MMTKQQIRCAALSLLLFLIMMPTSRADNESVETPIRRVRVTIPASGHHELLERLNKVAHESAFAIRVGKPTPEENRVLIQMWREDFKVIAVNPFSTEAFRISFYRNGLSPEPVEALDPLISALKSEVSQMQGASFSEE